MCRFASLDLSPHAGYEWLLSTSTDISCEDLERAFHVARELIDADDETQKELQAELRKLFLVTFGVPVAVGAGRQATRHKVHATIHAARFVNRTWRDACRYVNSIFAMVGDLGEKKIASYKQNARHLMGEWIAQSDGIVGGNFMFDFLPPRDEFEHVDQGSDHNEDASFGFDFNAEAYPDEPLGGENAEGAQADDVLRDPDLEIPAGILNQIQGADEEIAQPYEIDLRRTVFFGGPHHLLHNWIKTLTGALSLWKWYSCTVDCWRLRYSTAIIMYFISNDFNVQAASRNRSNHKLQTKGDCR